MKYKWCVLYVCMCMVIFLYFFIFKNIINIPSMMICWIPTPILMWSGPFILMVLCSAPVVLIITVGYLAIKYVVLKNKGEIDSFRELLPSKRTFILLILYFILGLFFLGGLTNLFNKAYKRVLYQTILVIIVASTMIFSLQHSSISIYDFLYIWFGNFRDYMLLLMAYYYYANDVMLCSEAVVNGEDFPPRGLFKFWDKFVGIK
ncbi:MAG: hypothetical protein BZ136_09005 [Methanosphaera sp. rholeuAM74]|nr:MAG: hypothetical protein BZ136_09005 [Methanosphaera sp. rholeuAM74]